MRIQRGDKRMSNKELLLWTLLSSLSDFSLGSRSMESLGIKRMYE